MPSHEEHCQESLRKYGKTFSELHRWMDAPSTIMGSKHRIYRHDPYKTPKEASQLFGEYADQACLDHIIADKKDSRSKGLKVIRPVKKSGIPEGIALLFFAFLSLLFGFLLLPTTQYGVSGWLGVLSIWFLGLLCLLGFLGSLIKEKPTKEVYRYELELKPRQMERLEQEPHDEKQNDEVERKEQNNE